MITYGQSIYWTDKDGSKLSVTVDGHATPEQAIKAAKELAELFGWAPPKWYEWHRRHDTRLDAQSKCDGEL